MEVGLNVIGYLVGAVVLLVLVICLVPEGWL